MDRRRAEARLLSRIVRLGLLFAVIGQIAWSFRPSPSVAQADQLALGRTLYETNCTTCQRDRHEQRTDAARGGASIGELLPFDGADAAREPE
jgi:hypothetical protein